ncbi:MAG TPA: ABC transporter substrate-binding protein [Terriglobales bacterium]|nr:ABC transporter substrate-binding protein [Terriglobales bacterium]
MDKVKVGVGVSSIGRFLPLAGKAAGLFEQEHIEIEVVNRQDEEQVVADMVTREVPIGTPNAPSLIFSLLKGNDLVIVGGVLNRPAFYLVADSSLAAIADLNGRKIGINQPRRMAGMVMLALCRRWQLKPELVHLGLNDKSLTALRAGQIDAALLPPEKAFIAEDEGLRLIANSLDLDCHWVPLATTRSFLASHRDLVKKIVSIYVESIRVFKSCRQEMLEELGRWLPVLAKKPRVLERCYELFAEQFEPTLKPSLASLRAVVGEIALQDLRAQNVKAESLFEDLTQTG